jgi:hypothetical protein
MAANPEVLRGRSSARRVVLDAPQDDLALTFDDIASMVFDDLDSNDSGSSASRETLQSISSALRETLS